MSLNPLKHLSREEATHSAVWSSLTSVLATVMSPVGLTILIGDLLKKTKRDPLRGAFLAYSVRDAIKNATYIGGTLIPLLVIKQPTGPMSAGPAMPFFMDIAAVGSTAAEYLTTHYSYAALALHIVLSATIGAAIAYTVLVKYSRKLTLLVFRRVSAEALYALFISIVLLLGYHDAGLAGIFGVLIISIVSGLLHEMGVSLGVLFMTLVATPVITAFIKLL